MKKILALFAALAFISFGFTPGAIAAGMDKTAGFSAEAKDVNAWIGKDVRNPQGEDLGEVKDFVRDDNGEVSLVIISHGGFLGMGDETVAVPYSAFSYREGENHVMLDVTKDQLANAPKIEPNENLADRSFAEEVYNHFGERPYWTDERMDTREYFGRDRDFDYDRDWEYDRNLDYDDKDLDYRGGGDIEFMNN